MTVLMGSIIGIMSLGRGALPFRCQIDSDC